MFAKFCSTFIGKRVSPSRFELSNLCKKIMIAGGITSYPVVLFSSLLESETARMNYGSRADVFDYAAMSIFALIPSALIGVATPAVLYSSVVWGPLYVLNNYGMNREIKASLKDDHAS
jgi:hypothetical protein